MKELQRELSEHVIRLAYKVKGAQLKHPLGPRDTPKDQKKKMQSLRQGNRAHSPSQRGEEPILGEGVGQGGGRASLLHTIASFSSLALHGPTLMSSCTAP